MENQNGSLTSQVLFLLLLPLRATVAVLLVLAGLVLTGICGVCAWGVGEFYGRFRPWVYPNPGVYWQRRWTTIGWWLICRPAFIHLRVSDADCRIDQTRPVINLVTHPTNSGLIAWAYSALRHTPAPWRWAMKKELEYTPIGRGLAGHNGSIVVDRDNRASSVEALSARTIADGSAFIMADGTRPTRRSRNPRKSTIESGQARLRERGYSEGDIARLHSTTMPRPSGPLALLRAHPDAQWVLHITFCSVQEEGYLGPVRMIFGGVVYHKMVDLRALGLSTHDDEQFATELITLWLHVNDYIAEVRRTGNIDTPFPLPKCA